jgi:thiol-disulfide isomerase/thioredoxin
VPGKKVKKKEDKLKKKSQKNKVVYTSVALAVILVIAVGIYFVVVNAEQSNPARYLHLPISPTLYSSLTHDASSGYSQDLASVANASVFTHLGGTPWYAQDGKPIIVYIGGEYCPFCAATRWALTIALLRFGNFSGLEYMLSSSSDSFPDTPTFTYVNATYTSRYIVFRPFEAFARNYVNGQPAPLETVPSNYSQVWQSVGEGKIPFIDFANIYALEGALFLPQVLDGYTWTQIANILGQDGVVSQDVYSEANIITALICTLDNNTPYVVCSNPTIKSMELQFTAPVHSVLSFQTGYPIATTVMWTAVQYRQIDPSTYSENRR